MINQRGSIASPAAPAQSAGRRWRYPVLLAIQTIGLIILFWTAVPLYRQILADPASPIPRNEHLMWSLSSMVLMQVGYWISERVRPPSPNFTNALLGHITLFLARGRETDSLFDAAIEQSTRGRQQAEHHEKANKHQRETYY
jgi:hypothetical protein